MGKSAHPCAVLMCDLVQSEQHKNIAELVGSLFSIFWTMRVTSGWLAYDHRYGSDPRTQAVTLLGMDAKPDMD